MAIRTAVRKPKLSDFGRGKLLVFYGLMIMKSLSRKIIGTPKRTPMVSKTCYDLADDDWTTDRHKLFFASSTLKYAPAPELYKLNAEALVSELSKFGQVESILDIGCGNLFNLSCLRTNLSEEVKLYGVDISENRIRIGNEHTKGMNIALFVASAEHLPFGNESVDVIFTVHALEQMPTIIDEVFQEFYRVCRKGIILIEPFYEHQNVFGKFHNWAEHYVRRIHNQVLHSNFHVKKFELLPFGGPVNRPSVLVATKGRCN